jgi:hypothetical protein
MESFDRDDFELRIGGDGLEFRTRELGGQTMSWVVLPKGADLSPALKGLPDDLCQCPHWGYMISGRLRMHTANGDRVYEAGQAFYWGPGHAPEALEDTEYVDISPTHELEHVIAHVTGSAVPR